MDLKRFPLLSKALEMAQIATIGPGEILYTPPMWWHHIESAGLNIMVNTWLVEYPNFLTDAIRVFKDTLVAFSDAPPRMKSLWRDFFCFYVFRTPYEPKFLREEVVTYIPRTRHFNSIAQTVSDALLSFDDLPEYWRSYLALMFDYFVFEIYGNPYPTLPEGTSQQTLRRIGLPDLIKA
jgi:hypothetical protein